MKELEQAAMETAEAAGIEFEGIDFDEKDERKKAIEVLRQKLRVEFTLFSKTKLVRK